MFADFYLEIANIARTTEQQIIIIRGFAFSVKHFYFGASFSVNIFSQQHFIWSRDTAAVVTCIVHVCPFDARAVFDDTFDDHYKVLSRSNDNIGTA